MKDPVTRRKWQAPIVVGMVACAAAVILELFELDFVLGVCLRVSLASFFLGFRGFTDDDQANGLSDKPVA